VFVYENDLYRSARVARPIRLTLSLCCVVCPAWLLREGHAITVLHRTELYSHNARVHLMS
jgi:hypothetical protein